MKFILLFFSFATSFIYAQTQKEIDDNFVTAYHYYNNYEWVEALKLMDKNLENSKKINYTYGIQKSYLNKAKVLNSLGYHKRALASIDTLKKEYLDKDDYYIVCELYRVNGNIYENINSYDLALENYYNQLKYSYKVDKKDNIDKFQRIWAYDNLISVYSYQFKTDSIWKYINQKSIELNKLDDKLVDREYGYLYSDYASLYLKLKRYDEALYYINKSEERFLKSNDDPYVYSLYKIKGDYYFSLNKYQLAIDNYKLAINYSNQVNANGDNDRLELYKKLSAVYFILNDEENGKKYLSFFKTAKFNKETKNNEVPVSIKKSVNTYYYIIFIIVFILIIILFVRFFKNSKKEDRNQFVTTSQDDISFVINLATTNDPNFYIHFKQLYPNLIQNLTNQFPDLTLKDLLFCAYIYLGFSTKEIAEYTFVTNRAIQVRKNRLRKKLNLDSSIDFYKWIQEI